ncbi:MULTISPECIES: hypothetical protein [unclassified Ruegeria]|uniref:hypothetical protein n=1 Tax=unclassified Ruegeria TaxID=2625375 RepID=UPI001AE61E8C|nr:MULTISPECIES: hypothetical protein [unclassified Ruegeria]
MDVLINPMMAERGLRQMLSRTNNQTTKMISEIAALLRNLARILNASDDTRDALSRLAARLAVKPQNGMTQKTEAGCGCCRRTDISSACCFCLNGFSRDHAARPSRMAGLWHAKMRLPSPSCWSAQFA